MSKKPSLVVLIIYKEYKKLLKMKDSKYKYLIIRHLEGDIGDKDLIVLLDWLDEDPANKKLFFEIKDIWDARQAGNISLPEEALWKKSLLPTGKLYEMPRWRKLAIHIGKYAAMIAVIVTISVLLQKKEPVELSNEIVYHHISVQNGKQSQPVVLADGTRVWLNDSSSLKYPELFDATQRAVWLVGEAYFEVAENETHPFVVHTGMLDVKVLGTHFNVMAYASDPIVTTTLIEGKVELWIGVGETVYAATLTPNQQAVYLKGENKVTLRTVNADLYAAWKDGYYKFNNTSFGEIAELIEKMYHVQITFIDESLRRIPYSGTFVQEQGVREMLEIIRNVKPFKYTIKENHITITREL